MRGLADKLARLKLPELGGRAIAAPVPAPVESSPNRDRLTQLRALLGELEARTARKPAPPKPPPAPLPGHVRETPSGALHVVEQWLEPHHHHGRVRIADALGVDASLVAKLALDPTLAGFDPRSMLLVDTETTGLSGGTGTLPFLVGLAWFEDESLKVEQLFLRRPGEEPPILHRVAERIAQASAIVSFNGKSFDWPLLRTRFVMNRVPCPQPPPHLDLLHCARRVFGPRLRTPDEESSGLRLVQLEQRVLGLHREDDIAGAEIPATWLAFLRRGDASGVVPVLEHNASDLIALAALLATLVQRFAAECPEDDPRDQLAMARVALRASDPQRAFAFARAASEGGDDPVAADALLFASKLSRRHGDAPAARDALLRALEGQIPASSRARLHLELAKLLEHKLGDPAAALAHAELAAGAEDETDRARRLARLEARLDRGRRSRSRAAAPGSARHDS